MSGIVKLVKGIRDIRNIRQVGLVAAVGISRPYLSQIERGHRRASAELQARLFKALREIARD